jgi:uncharacterized protein
MSDLSKKLKELFKLQLIDNEIMEYIRWIRNVEKTEDPVQKKYRELTAKIDSFENDQNPFKDKAKELQDQAVLLKEKKKQIEDKLFSPNTEPKELQYLQKEREQTVNLIKAHDDEVVKLMVNVDSVEIKKNEMRDQIKEIEKEYNRVTKERLENKEKYTKRIEELKEERKKFKKFEDKDLLAMYQRLQRDHDGVAIATVEEGICTGCNVEVSRSNQQQLDNDTLLVYCQRCGRILFDAIK